MSIIAKYSCGCIGIPIGLSTSCILINACDRNAYVDQYSLHTRDMADKTCQPITPKEQEELLKELSHLIHLGYRMKELASTITYIQERNRPSAS